MIAHNLWRLFVLEELQLARHNRVVFRPTSFAQAVLELIQAYPSPWKLSLSLRPHGAPRFRNKRNCKDLVFSKLHG